MAESSDWTLPEQLQPQPDEVRFDLETALRSVVLLRAEVPEDAFTASILGTERVGNGVVIREDGLVLTIGYLTTEAESIWLTANDGTVVAGHALAYDYATGFGLVLPLAHFNVPLLARGSTSSVELGDDAIVMSHGGLPHALRTQIVAKREFAGYWEYLLDEALFTVPAHPHWSGAALVNEDGQLLGIGSLLVHESVRGETVQANMFVPIDLLRPILDDMSSLGHPAHAPRPWLGIYTTELQGHVVVNGLAEDGPADLAGVQAGDLVLEVAGQRVSSLAELYRGIWQLGHVGTEVPLTLARGTTRTRVKVRSADRNDFLKKPQRH